MIDFGKHLKDMLVLLSTRISKTSGLHIQ